MNASSSPSICLYLLGRFEVARGDRVLRAGDWSRRKAAALLQRLALDRRLLRDQAIDFLWPEADLDSGANNLYRTLHALRQTLDQFLGAGAAQATLTFEDGVLSLSPEVWVDAHAFEQASRAAAELGALRAALDLYVGDLLPDDIYADWTVDRREALRHLWRETVRRLAVGLGEARDYPAAAEQWAAVLARDRADEDAHRELMRAYALSGRRHDALRQYQACVEVLAAELAVTPDPTTTALYTRILNGELAPELPLLEAAVPAAGAGGGGPALFGREAEYETLRLWLRDAWRRRGRAVLLSGDSGVGKTRLALEVLCAAAGAGFTPLSGAAYEQEGQLAYQPFIEAFRRHLAETGRPAEANPITHFKRLGSSDPQQEQWALFNAVASFLTELAGERPVVLFLDDLHAADEASLRLFHFLARQVRSAPIILLAAYRTDAPAAPAFSSLVNALYRERLGESLPLAPLSVEAVAGLLAQALGGAVSARLTEIIFSSTEGNPFFIQEMVTALMKSGSVVNGDGEWRLTPDAELTVPANLAELLRDRVRRHEPPFEAVLAAAAVLGREFRFEVLRRIADLPDGVLLDALDMALQSRLLEETAAGYRFRHPLIRLALTAGLSRARQTWLHGRAAETMENLYAGAPGGLWPHVEGLAFHHEHGEHPERAIPYLLQAGQKAAGLYAFEVAVGHFERALALMEALGFQDAAQRWMVLESLGWWHTILANTPQAVQRFGQAAALAPGPAWGPARRDRARVHRGAVVALITAGDIAGAQAHLQAALAEVDEAEDAAEYAHVLYNAAQVYWHRGEYPQASEAAQHSLRVAERLDDPAAIARAFEMLALACHSLGDWQDGLQFEARRASLAGAGLDVTEAFDVHL